MSIEEKILEQQIARGVFENAEFPATEGIARLAVDKGFRTLSEKQQKVLAPYLSAVCSGITDPGGHHNECSAELDGQELLDAYLRCEDTESLTCESCYNEKGYYAHQWEQISQE